MTTTTVTREYKISDEGEAFDLMLLEDGEQVGGGYFPFILGEDSAFDLAKSMGEHFLEI